MEGHHVERLEDGGDPYDVDNVRTLCRSCHIAAHRREVAPAEGEWEELVKELIPSASQADAHLL